MSIRPGRCGEQKPGKPREIGRKGISKGKHWNLKVGGGGQSAGQPVKKQKGGLGRRYGKNKSRLSKKGREEALHRKFIGRSVPTPVAIGVGETVASARR